MSTLDRLRELVRGTGGKRPGAPSGGAGLDVRRGPDLSGAAGAGAGASRWDAEEIASEGSDGLRQGPARQPGQGLRELTYEPVDQDGLPLPSMSLSAACALRGASPLETPLGRIIIVDHCFEAESSHGRHVVRRGVVSPRDVLEFCGVSPADRLARSASLDEDVAAAAWADVEPVRPDVLFLDLETTGLSGGAGTLAFLVGCGFFDQEGAFRTRQFLLPSFSSERALLHAVTALIRDAGCLVTYNGRTFDVPVMETRWLFHRVPLPWTDLPHLDMLPLSRRLWRDRDDIEGQGCRLVTLERDLFGVVREGDVPGFEIPGRYFDYIRGGDASLLEPVLEHNRLDLLSLALLTARAMRLVREGVAGTSNPQECLALGRELWRRRDSDRAVECFRAAAEAPMASSTVRADALHAWARLLRRHRRHGEAADIWTRLVTARGARAAARAEAREALAIHYEHRARNLEAAHEWAQRAYDAKAPASRREAVEHRLARLRRKIRVQTEGGPRTALLLDDLL